MNFDFGAHLHKKRKQIGTGVLSNMCIGLPRKSYITTLSDLNESRSTAYATLLLPSVARVPSRKENIHVRNNAGSQGILV